MWGISILADFGFIDLWGMRFHAVEVFGLGKNLLFKSVLGHCVNLSLYNFDNVCLGKTLTETRP